MTDYTPRQLAGIKRYGSYEAYKQALRERASKGGKRSVELGHLQKVNFKANPERAREAGKHGKK